jgi:GNAT superfamily N-acetyltransferase
VIVRRGLADDAPTLARLRWRWWVEERAAEQIAAGVDREVFLDYFTTWTLDHLATHLSFVVEVDGRICGMAWLMLANRVPNPRSLDRRMGDVQSVYVVPELRNNGVGGALITAIMAEARARELDRLTVHAAERAMPFYLRAGFRDQQNWLEWRP